MIVVELDTERWGTLDGRDLEQAAKKDLHEPAFDIVRELQRSGVKAWVATSDGVAMGVLLASFLTDEVEVISVVVAPGARRRGVGVLLVRSMLDASRDASMRVALLEVRRQNVAALTVYERAGFWPYGIRRRYYSSPPDDAIQMVAEIEPGASAPFEPRIALP